MSEETGTLFDLSGRRRTPEAAPRGEFGGVTYEAGKDRERLTRLLDRVRELMIDRQWRTLETIASKTGGSEASVSARLRDLRKPDHGGYQVDRRRVAGGLFEYRVNRAGEGADR